MNVYEGDALPFSLSRQEPPPFSGPAIQRDGRLGGEGVNLCKVCGAYWDCDCEPKDPRPADIPPLTVSVDGQPVTMLPYVNSTGNVTYVSDAYSVSPDSYTDLTVSYDTYTGDWIH